MSRLSVLHTSTLLCLFLMQGWLIYRVETSLARTTASLPEANKQPAIPAASAALNSSDSAAFATQINARLSALENRATASTNPVATEEQAPIALDGAAAREADRKLEAMLPAEPMTHEEMMIFQAQLGQLPGQERHQLMAALSRAINNGRVRLKLN